MSKINTNTSVENYFKHEALVTLGLQTLTEQRQKLILVFAQTSLADDISQSGEKVMEWKLEIQNNAESIKQILTNTRTLPDQLCKTC